MRTVASMCLGLSFWMVFGGVAWAQGGLGFDARELFLRLDANNDTVIDRDEVPEAGLAAFDKLLKLGDTDKNGRLELAELRALGEKIRAAGPIGAAGLLQRFQAIDKDRDGKISRAEFPGQPPLFERLDADKDGFLTKEEIVKEQEAARAGFAAERLKAMDKDGDGKISRQEFQGPEPAFDRLDANGDGFLTKEELARFSAPAANNQSGQRKPEAKGTENKQALSPDQTKSGAAEFGPRLKAMDKDGDGKISRAEFQGREAMFDRLDSNKDGFLTNDEAAKLPQRLGAQRFKALDKDGDGKLSRDEFPGRPRVFDKLDTDKDGFLSREEAAKFPEVVDQARQKQP